MSQVIITIAGLSAIAAANAADAKEVKLVGKVNDLIAKLQEAGVAVTKYIDERTAAELASKVEVNDTVAFTYGRAETKKELEGKVLAVVETPAGKLLKVLAGEGADMKVYDVRAKDATVKGSEPAQVEAGVANDAALTVDTPADAAPADAAPAGTDGQGQIGCTGAAVDVDALIGSL